jgi:hypothetical protein
MLIGDYMKNKNLEAQSINFNDEKEVEELIDETVEISVGTLSCLLDFFHIFGNENKDKNERLQIAMRLHLAMKYAKNK